MAAGWRSAVACSAAAPKKLYGIVWRLAAIGARLCAGLAAASVAMARRLACGGGWRGFWMKQLGG